MTEFFLKNYKKYISITHIVYSTSYKSLILWALWINDFVFLLLKACYKVPIRKLDFQIKLDILLEMGLSDVAKQGYRKLVSRFYIADIMSHTQERRFVKDEKDICLIADCRTCFAGLGGL